MTTGIDSEQLALLLEGPALTPPANVTYDFEHPGGYHSVGYAVIITCGVLATISVALRLGTRIAMKNVGIPEALYVSALGLFSGDCYVKYEAAIYPGISVHQWNIPLKELSPLLYKLHIGTITYSLICMNLKIGIVLDWINLFVPTGQRNKMFWCCWFIIGTVITFYLVLLPIEIWQCTPREKIWNKLYQGGFCIQNPAVRNFAGGFVAVLTDLAIFALPQNVIWGLHTNIKKKIGISVLFTAGLLACASACARQGSIWHMIHSDDQTYYIGNIGLWSIAEVTAGFLIVGIPSTPKAISLLRHGSFSKFISSTGKSSQRTDSAPNRYASNSSWKRPPVKDRHGQWQTLDADEHALVSAQAMQYPTDVVPEQGIIKHLDVDVTSEGIALQNVPAAKHQRRNNAYMLDQEKLVCCRIAQYSV